VGESREVENGVGKRALIVTPTYNERANLERFVAEVRRLAPSADMLIVDDASPDGTGDIADDIARRDAQVKVLHRAGKLGLGTAYIDAFRQGLAEGYDLFFEMDADLSHDPKYLPDFFRALTDGADVVVGSRNIPGGAVEGWGAGRQVLSKGGSLYSRVILGVGVRDLTTGYKAFTKNALLSIDLDTVRSNGYSFQIEMTFRALRRNLRVVEVPIVFVDRTLGQSKMNGKIFREAIGIVWKLRYESARGRL
jgi:dolichol-phosphate mannosyltransferase